MVTLPDAAWRHREGLDALMTALGQARFVGGAVRDTLLGVPVADVDIATPLPPEDVVDRLAAARIKVVPTGIAHGTVTAVLASGPVEVTTLRRDVATDGRHATVAFTEDWHADAARRDFTINALYADPATGEVIDYFGGIDDLFAGRVRFIGDPYTRIAEDHLRILRYFRFLARFGDTPDAAALKACTVRANDLMALSRERIRDELLKLLVAPRATAVVRLMIERRILLPVIPEIGDDARLAGLAAREADAGITPDPLRRLRSLLPDDAAEAVGARLKLSNAQRKRLAAAGVPVGDAGWKELAYRDGTDGAVDRLLLSDRPIAEAQAALAWERQVLPIGGGALVARGLRKGPDVARMLRQIEDEWIAADFPPVIDDLVDQAMASIA